MWKIYIVVIAVCWLFACGEKAEAPYLFLPISDNQEYRSGDTAELKATITDDESLAQLNITTSSLDSFLQKNIFQNISDPFSFSQLINISGTTYFYTNNFIIPDSAASGDYYFTFTASDEDGFITNQYLNFSVQNSLDTTLPTILDTIPDTISVGNIPVEVTFIDDQELAAAELILRRKDSTNANTYLILPLSSQSVFTNQQIPVNAIGIYNLEIIVRDWVNNVAVKTKKIVVIN